MIRARSLLAPALAALLLAAACSGSDSPDGAADPEATTTEAPADDGADDATPAAAEPLARYADYETQNYADASRWLCRPDVDDDFCDVDLDTTVIAADGSTEVERFAPAEDPPIDCFYVYPTVSGDPGAYSDWEISPDEEGFVATQQAARLASQCRVFAPVYRQGTLAGITSRLSGGDPPEGEGDPYADVLDAFRTYLAEDNGGRGFVLVGHSQGTFQLIQLIAEEIDGNDDVREKLVGAYLAGGGVAVPDGEIVGGAFENVPLCTEPDEVGCVTTWSTFRSTAPPEEGALFGTVRGGEAGQVAGCVNPADPTGGATDARSYFPVETGDSAIAALTAGEDRQPWLDPSAGTIETPFVSLPGLVTVRCTSEGPYRYLEATVNPDPDGPRVDDIPGDLTPDWGLHLVDVNLVMGDVVDAVGRQADAYAG